MTTLPAYLRGDCSLSDLVHARYPDVPVVEPKPKPPARCRSGRHEVPPEVSRAKKGCPVCRAEQREREGKG